MHPLWGDEAETALFARNILKCGVPCGWDGVNIMGINDAVVLNKDLVNHTSPWTQYYVTAASFALFGQSSFTARLPFMLLSIVSFPLLYLLANMLTNSKRTAFLTILIASLSIPFILFAYQTRYYSITNLAGILLVLSCLTLAKRNWLPKLLFIFSGTLFFYGNYISFVAFIASTFLSMLIFFLVLQKPRREIGTFIISFLGASSIIAALSATWYFILKPFETRGEIVISSLSAVSKELPIVFREAFTPYNANSAFPLTFVVLFIMIVIFKHREKDIVGPIVFSLLLPFLYLFIMSFFTVVAVVDTSFIHTRYTMVIFPFLAMACALIISHLWGWKKEIAAIVLVAFLFTNIFTLQKPRSLFLEFLGEVKNPYATADKVVADYLRANAQDGDSAFVSLDRDHEPLIFHLRDKIRFINRVSLTNTRIFPENRKVIPRYIYDFRDEPDWVILYSKRGNDTSFLTFDYRQTPPEIDLENHYEEIILPIFFSDMSRPEIELRSFTKIDPTPDDRVFIYKKKS